MHPVIALLGPLWSLDAVSPAELAQRLGVELELSEDKFGYARYRGVHPLGTLEIGHRASANATHLQITVAGTSFVEHDPLHQTFGLGSFGVDPPELGTTYLAFARAKHRVTMRWTFVAGYAVRSVSLGWAPNAAPQYLIVSSYDRADQQLRLTVRGACTIIPTDPANVLTLGAFVFEYKRHLGVYASPSGPVFFMDNDHISGAFGEIVVTAKDQRFRVAKGRTAFEIPYVPRTGLHTNPYDVEQADIDLFALMERGARNPTWWAAYTKPWQE